MIGSFRSFPHFVCEDGLHLDQTQWRFHPEKEGSASCTMLSLSGPYLSHCGSNRCHLAAGVYYSPAMVVAFSFFAWSSHLLILLLRVASVVLVAFSFVFTVR